MNHERGGIELVSPVNISGSALASKFLLGFEFAVVLVFDALLESGKFDLAAPESRLTNSRNADASSEAGACEVVPGAMISSTSGVG